MFDYFLIAGTGVLFLLYFPVFGAVPHLATRNIGESHLMWVLPLLMMCSCLAVLCSWMWQGLRPLGRAVWAAAFSLAVLGYPAAFLVAAFSGAGRTRTHSSQPPAEPPPPIEPTRP